MEINFRIFGPTTLRIGGHFVHNWAQPKPRGMLSVLLLQPRQAVSVDELIDWMWPDDRVPLEPVDTLYTYRKRIVTALNWMESPPRIHTRGRTYQLDVDREEIDLFDFRRRVTHARAVSGQGDHAGATKILSAAIDLWTGQPLADLQGDRAQRWRRAVEADHFIPAHGALLLGLCALGEYEEVLRRIADLPLKYQTNLTLVKHRLTALRRLHRPEATTYFLDERKRLLSEGDHEAADELRRFHDEIQRPRTRPPAVVAGSQFIPSGEAPNLLPHDISDFTGRAELIRRLDAISTTAAGRPAATIAVLSGDAGVGKTALVVHWAHRAAERFKGGQLYLNLNGYADVPKVEPEQVVDEFLAALGLPPEQIPTATGRMSRLRALLSGPRALVVLDNVRDSEHVRVLLDCFSNCMVLLTSRRRLRGVSQRGAASIPVLPFTHTEAKTWLIRWFESRAVAEPTAVGELAGLCGGVALALRIVIDHVESRRGVALAEFVDELRDEQALLGLGQHGDGPDRSVRAALSWSYQALAEEEQRSFRLLGINPGPDISLAAAGALLGRERKYAQRTLDILVDTHLLGQPNSRDRYRLHDIPRRYARECAIDTEERSAAEARLLSFYLATANNADRMVIPNRVGVRPPPVEDGIQPLTFTDEDSVMRWAVQERANINSTLGLAVSRGAHSYISKLPSMIGEIFLRLGYRNDVAAALRMATRSAHIVGDKYEEASWWRNLAFTYITLHDFDAAQDSIKTARDIFQQIKHPLGIALVEHLQGRLFVEQGELQHGIDIQLSALDKLRQLDARAEETIALRWLGESYRRMGALEAAMSTCLATLRSSTVDNHTKGCLFAELAAISFERGNLTAAMDYCRQALNIHEQVDAAQCGKVYIILASVHLNEEGWRDAETCARRALTYCRGARDARGQAEALRLIAELMHRQARYSEAEDAWSLAISLFESVNDKRAVTAVHTRLAEIMVSPPVIPLERTEPLETRPTLRFTQ